MNQFQEKMGPEALERLNEILKREANIMNTKGDFEIKREALKLMLEWIGSVYDLTQKPAVIEPELDLNKLFKVKNNQ